MTIIELFNKGGVIVWLLLMTSIVALSIIMERVLHFLLLDHPVDNSDEVFNSSFSLDTVEQQLKGLKGPEANIMRGIFNA